MQRYLLDDRRLTICSPAAILCIYAAIMQEECINNAEERKTAKNIEFDSGQAYRYAGRIGGASGAGRGGGDAIQRVARYGGAGHRQASRTLYAAASQWSCGAGVAEPGHSGRGPGDSQDGAWPRFGGGS